MAGIIGDRTITSLLKKYETAKGVKVEHLNALIYFVDNLLQLPEEMKRKLRGELNPYLGEEVYTKMRTNNINSLPTLGELMKESKEGSDISICQDAAS